MHTNQHLFGTDEVPEFDPHVIMRRTNLLKEHLHELLDHSTFKRTEEEAEQIRDVLKAINWHDDISKNGGVG